MKCLRSVALLAGIALSANANCAEQPNILFIMSDDHTTQAIGAYSSRLAELNPTPNSDALAKEGIRFDRVFCNNSICTPSRASIITGQYPQTNGVLNLTGNIPPERQYLPIEMGKALEHVFDQVRAAVRLLDQLFTFLKRYKCIDITNAGCLHP